MELQTFRMQESTAARQDESTTELYRSGWNHDQNLSIPHANAHSGDRSAAVKLDGFSKGESKLLERGNYGGPVKGPSKLIAPKVIRLFVMKRGICLYVRHF
jgi:hypothetical protein